VLPNENRIGERIVYALLPWKWLSTALALLVAAAVYADDLAALAGYTMPESVVVRLLPVIVLGAVGGFFGPTGHLAPWRVLWRWFPSLNSFIFPDLNGTWVGSTRSNWPTIARMLDAAQAHRAIDATDLAAVPPQEDALAVEIIASLFSVRVAAALSSTNGNSHSVFAKPRLDPVSGRVHLTYVYQQVTPEPAAMDDEVHMGAADVTLDPGRPTSADGVYWTRRKWRLGLNTAGRIELRRLAERRSGTKTLREHALEERERMARAVLAQS
jgi:SMODS-associating 2TM, beta-strand rich effector domain